MISKKRSLAFAIALSTLALVSGCGGDDGDTDDPGTTVSADPTSDSPSEEESEPAEGGGVLTAAVGSEDDPDAFVIMLTDESGADVTELPAGDYTIEVSDFSTIHNFHLTGGAVDETTAVPETGDATWEVTLEAGEYTFKCDPHPNMVGGFTVT